MKLGNLDSFINNIFNAYALKNYAWFLLYHFPTPQYFLHPFVKLEIASHHHDQLAHGGKQSMYHFKSLKEKTVPLHVNLSRKK